MAERTQADLMPHAPPRMAIEPGAASFGRHESFPLRFGWIAKALAALRERPRLFHEDDATVVLGVGKNMVASMRYWLHAARLVQGGAREGLRPTAIAETAFGADGDPYLEDDGSIWLLHWLLATNATQATAIYWFFNHFHKLSFTQEEVSSALRDFAQRQLTARTSVRTLDRDAALVLRMYARSHSSDRIALEDSLDSPLALLDLHARVDARNWRAAPTPRADLPLPVFGFAVAELFEATGRQQLPIHDLMYSTPTHCGLGAVFRMTEEGLVGKLERLCETCPLVLDRTAGVYQLYKREAIEPGAVLREAYAAPRRELAA